MRGGRVAPVLGPPRSPGPGLPRVILRLASPEFDQLQQVVFRRYPDSEWASFAWFGWRVTADALVLTLAGIEPPTPGDMDESVRYVKIGAPYTSRVALAAEKRQLAVGVVHSHPRESMPTASEIDDDMDRYFADYFGGFAPGRPYASLIVAERSGRLAVSGRVFWRGQWLPVQQVAAERQAALETWAYGAPPALPPVPPERVARFTSAFGKEAYQRLRRSCVAVIGAGGTGSAAIPILARAGVGRLIIADSDRVSESNLERIHASRPEHAANATPKAMLAYQHVRDIDPNIEVEAYIGRLPQKEVVDAIVTADVLIGCTDQQSSRMALSDIVTRYLVPAIDCGGLIEGRDGRVTGQIGQLVRFLSNDPCALCRGMVDPKRAREELLADGNRERRRTEATAGPAETPAVPVDPGAISQIDTVGYITTVTGTLAAGYVIGWLSGRFDAPFERLQMNFVADCLDVTNRKQIPRADCTCRRVRGWADQGAESSFEPPAHWPAVEQVTL